MSRKILLVGNFDKRHLGWHFYKATDGLPEIFYFLDTHQAYQGLKIFRSLLWKFFDRRPIHLRTFSKKIVNLCIDNKITDLIALGMAPIDKFALENLRSLKIKKINFLTDDPWNSNHGSKWFFKSLKLYDFVFSPRENNIKDLENYGVSKVVWLPFGYDPTDHVEIPHFYGEKFDCDIMFVGGADTDRIPIIKEIINCGIKPSLYGGYWNTIPDTKAYAKGIANLEQLKIASKYSKISLCLVRRANRDGHVMRTFESAASGSCMLVEDTNEHRSIFGNDGDCVVYFSNDIEMVSKAKWLINHPDECFRLRQAVYKKIVLEQHNSYLDRLKSILEFSMGPG